MRYVRVILAIPDNGSDVFYEDLDEFIEGCDLVEGAYVSKPYPTREEALGTDFVSK